jgi:hemoglobin/transferrin/lactoferrin receptor protein
MIKLLLLLTGIGLQTPEDSLSNRLDEVVVTAVRAEQKVFDAPASVEVINSKTLAKRAARSTPEILMSAPGVFLQKTNHGGGSPFVRGLTGNQTLLLIDGIRLNNSTFRYGPNQYFNTINPFSIDHIEVLRSGGSVQYGSDALGGTIHVITEKPEFDAGWNANLGGRWASHNQEKTANAALSYGAKNMAISLSGALRNFGDLGGGKNTGFQSPSGYDEQMLNFKTLLKANKGLFTLAHQYFEASDVPVYHKMTLENYRLNEFNPQRRNLSYAKYELEGTHSLFSKLSLTASLQQTKEGRLSEKLGNNVQVNEEDKVRTYGLSAVLTSGGKRFWQVSTGLEYYSDFIQSNKISKNLNSGKQITARGLYPDASTAASFSAFSIHSFIYKNWKLTTGLRLSQFNMKIKDETLGEVTLSPMAIRPTLALSRYLDEKIHLFFNYSGGFRAPNIDDMGTLGIVDFRYEIPSYQLKPEKSDAFDLGLKYRGQKISFTTSAFYTKLSQLISRQKVEGEFINDIQVYEKVNSQGAYIQGFELTLDYNINKYLNLYGHTSYTFGQNLSKNEPLRRIPPLSGMFGMDFHKGDFFVKPEILFAARQNRLSAGDIDDNRIDPNGTAGWTIMNFCTGISKKHYDLIAQIQNIGNIDYRMHGSGINGVGRTLLLQLNLKL